MNKKTSLLFLVLMILMSVSLAACQSGVLDADEVAVHERQTAATIVDRIHFQDKRDSPLFGHEGAIRHPLLHADISLADRIRFHDQLWAKRNSGNGGLSLADRIRFHDRLSEGRR